VLFRLGDKEHLLIVANRLTLAGLACVAVSIVGALLFVTDLLFDSVATVAATATAAALMCLSWWCVAPLLRRRRIRSRRTLHRAHR
jgi:hypothetical protein